MISDTLDMNDDEIEEAADQEVEKVLFELTDGLLGQAGKVGSELVLSLAHFSLNWKRKRKQRQRSDWLLLKASSHFTFIVYLMYLDINLR